MTYLMAELETVRKLREEILRRKRRQALIAAVERADNQESYSQPIPDNSISLDWAQV
jgi:hypothetical protein